MFLREYVYVDVDRVAGLAAQLYDGVPEKATNIVARQKRLDVDLKFLKGAGESGNEEQTERSLADSLFKDLETDLEALGLLRDLSEELAANESWDDIEALVSAGQIVRITAPGTLFHPAQMSDAIVGIATAAVGLSDLGIEDELSPAPVLPPKAKTEAQKKAERAARQTPSGDPRYPEDYLPSVGVVPLMNLDRRSLAGMIKVTRGVFSEGVHLQLRPLGVDGPAITARLEAGRRFLDSSPEVLFSRYGLAAQEWTAVGVIGQLGSRISSGEVNDVTNDDGSVNRAKFVDLVGSFLASAAGFVDQPVPPGFSLIPLALYRGIGETVTGEG
jgi:hypothetical protein